MSGLLRRKAGSGKLRLPAWLTLLGWVVIAPAVALGLGVWEHGRAIDDLAEYGARQARLPDGIAQLERMAATDPMATVRFRDDATEYTPAVALQRLQGASSYLDQTVLLSRARVILARTAIVGGIVTLMASLLGLVAASVAALLARRSRENLVRCFALLRRCLPFLFVIQLAGLVAAVVGSILFEIGDMWFEDEISGGEVKLAMCGLIFCVLALYAAYAAVLSLRKVFKLLAPRPLDVNGEVVDAQAGPGLWMLVRELAKSQQSLVPDAIVVGLTGGFFVTSSAVHVLPEDRVLSGRTLYLPAPYLGFLSLRELAAIVGHELAHFSGDDTVFSQRFSPIYQGLYRAIEQLGELKGAGGVLLTPSTQLGFHAVQTFDSAVGRWSQRREFEADKLGSTVSGAQAAASALVRTGVVAPIIDQVLEKAFQAPDGSPADLVAETERVAATEGFGDPSEHLEDRKPHPTDSHPPTRRRIEAFGIAVDDALLAEATRAMPANQPNLPGRMFKDWPGLCCRTSDDFLARARGVARARQVHIEKTAAAMPQGETVLQDNVRVVMITRGVLTLLMFGIVTALEVYARIGGTGDAHDPATWLYLPLVFGTAGLIGLWGAVRAWRRLGQPMMVLDPLGIRAPVFEGVLPWHGIETYKLSVRNGRSLELRLVLDKGVPLPRRTGRTIRFLSNRKEHAIVFRSTLVRGMKPNAYAALIQRYLDAARASAVLAAQH